MMMVSKRRSVLTTLLLSLGIILMWTLMSTHSVSAQDPEGGDDDVAPSPPSIGADIPLSYFGPAPSTVQRELIGPYQLLRAGTIDVDAATITLPLYEGQLTDGRSVWYILTDTNDKGNADALGLNYSAKLTYAAVGLATRVARLEADTTLTFNRGTVDFSPDAVLVPGEGANAFPPTEATPGAVGDSNYSPLVRISNLGNTIYNAPIVAFDVDAEAINFCEGDADHSLVHDKVIRI